MDTEYAIEDTKDDWNSQMQEINDNLYKNALNTGITTKQFKFLTFNITDFDEDYLEDKEDKRQDRMRKYKSNDYLSKAQDIDNKGSYVSIQRKLDKSNER